MQNDAKDIWLRTRSTLDDVASVIGLTDTVHDAEDYWEWVIGISDGIELDITRTHTQDPITTDTRIFRVDNQPFSDSEVELLCKRLFLITETDIWLGRWLCLDGNEFEKVVISRLSSGDLSGEH